MTKTEKYVFLTHVCAPVVDPIRDYRSGYYGKYWILTDNTNIQGKYMTFKELSKFWDSTPSWFEEVLSPRIGYNPLHNLK